MTSSSGERIFLCITPTSMSFSFDTLMGQAQEVFNQDPLSGYLFLLLWSTLCDWVAASADLLQPLYELQRKTTHSETLGRRVG
jgi:hypothetical protein